MKTLLCVAPHLSTGGLPQYLTKKVESLLGSYNIYVVEYEDQTGGVLVVQKDRIRKMLGDRLITIPWGGNKNILIETITKLKPDIIHLEELPEYFMGDDIAKQIYTANRTYKIFETCHDSSFDCNNKRFFPDKFVLVSQFQVGMLKPLGIPSVVIEYPIEYKQRPDRTEALTKLGLDPDYKHILHVGLFTQRKNQKEFFEYAKNFSGKVMFHCVGNMADNFRDYWEPLMKNKPDNLIIHGEKSNVDDYYSAMDLFLFTSRGTVNDKETMPLVIREAISWSIPTLIYNLPVYQNYFDGYKSVSYLNFDNFAQNIEKIHDKLSAGIDVLEPMAFIPKPVVIISTYPTTKSIIDLTLRSITAAKQAGYEVILTSHAKVPLSLQEAANYVVYDSNNLLTVHDYYNSVFQENDYFRMDMNLTTEKNNIYHGPAVYTNYHNGITLAKGLSYKTAICFNYDMIISDSKVYDFYTNGLINHNAVFDQTKPEEGLALRTVMFATDLDFFLANFPLIRTEREYTSWKINCGSQSNGLENMFYNTLKDMLDKIYIINDDVFYGLLTNCEVDICSMVEYFNVLALDGNPNKFAVWFSSSNKIDSREYAIQVHNEIEEVFYKKFNVENIASIYEIIEFNGGVYKINLTDSHNNTKTIIVDQNYMNNQLPTNGTLRIKA